MRLLAAVQRQEQRLGKRAQETRESRLEVSSFLCILARFPQTLPSKKEK